MKMKKLCLSHVKDIDGLSSAALVRAATGCEFLLVDYDSLFAALDNLPTGLGELYICDLGTDQSRFGTISAKAGGSEREGSCHLHRPPLPSRQRTGQG